MSVPEQLGALLDLIVEIQNTLMSQQTMINELTQHGSNTNKAVTQNAAQSMANDNALLERIKNTENVMNGVLQRERREVVAGVGRSNID